MKSNTLKETQYRVQAVERALDILDCFTFQDREMSLSDVVRKTGLNKTTAKRLISNFTSRGYLQQNHQSKRYQLGLRLFELGGIVFSSFNLREVAAVPMTRLQCETGGTVLLGIMMEEQLVYVGKREGGGIIRISSDVGWRRPLHYGVLGMVLMAYLDEKTVRVIMKKQPLKAYTPYSLTDADAFSLRLEQIRNQGYFIEREEAVEGIIGIAAPIRNYSREVIAALGIAFPTNQSLLRNGMENSVELVKRTCSEISSELGYLKI